MNVRIGLIRKKPDWTREAFLQYWRATHGPLAARIPNLREYWQNVVTERMRRILSVPPGPWDFDGFSQLWFNDDQQASSAVKDSEFARALIDDEQHFPGHAPHRYGNPACRRDRTGICRTRCAVEADVARKAASRYY